MKRIFDMTEEEILALADEQIANLIDYECALEGAPMLPPAPGIKPVVNAPPPDVQAYDVAGIITMSADHAGRILAAIESEVIYSWEYSGNDYKTKHLSPISEGSYNHPKIKSEKYYSPAQWDAIKDAKAIIEEKLSQWEKVNKAYSEACDARASITDSVWEKVRGVRYHAYDRDQLRNEFTRYLTLAEGNRRIALNFLEKAKDLSDFPELKQEFCPPEEDTTRE